MILVIGDYFSNNEILINKFIKFKKLYPISKSRYYKFRGRNLEVFAKS